MVQSVSLKISELGSTRQRAEAILPRRIYDRIGDLLLQSLGKLDALAAANPGQKVPLDDARAHEAIFVQGDRGTGKSSVLVNLEHYLQSEVASVSFPGLRRLAGRILVLKPVDPTLLDSHHDLFLNVIVAAVTRSPEIQRRLHDGNGEDLAEFNQSLHSLGAALEAVQTTTERYGIDRLRSFMGNHGLAEEIHNLLFHALRLTGKSMIVLPIDDVDTSLHHAFNNLEIVRRYLASPYVVPVISGDPRLYHEVIWREMHGRMLKDSRAEAGKAVAIAKSLAHEYEVKVLPIPRRMSMPSIEDYLRDDDIALEAENGDPLMTLPQLAAWLTALLNERVNGAENSQLELPVRTLRGLTQLIMSVRGLIPGFARYLRTMDIGGLDDIKRLTFVSASTSRQLLDIDEAAPKGRTRRLQLAELSELRHAMASRSEEDARDDTGRDVILRRWTRRLRNHFFHLHDAGPAYLALDASATWRLGARGGRRGVLATALFQPMLHGALLVFDGRRDLRSEWLQHITEDDAPESWRNRLPETAILSYPTPELGSRMSSLRLPGRLAGDGAPEIEFVRRIMIHHNFYSRSKRTAIVFSGRLFELVVTSLVRNVTLADLRRILTSHPFYSLPALAQTKIIAGGGDEESLDEDDDFDNEDKEFSLLMESFERDFVDSVNSWREAYLFGDAPHPWLVYNVMNKFFTQMQVINPRRSGGDIRGSAAGMIEIAGQGFNALRAAFGSFEKGPLFDMDTIVAYQNIGNFRRFESSTLYHQNVRPLEQSIMGLLSVTQALAFHPLGELIRSAMESVAHESAEHPTLDTSIPLDVQLHPHAVMLARTMMAGISRSEIEEMALRRATTLVRTTRIEFANHDLDGDWKQLEAIADSDAEIGYRSSTGKLVHVLRRARARKS